MNHHFRKWTQFTVSFLSFIPKFKLFSYVFSITVQFICQIFIHEYCLYQTLIFTKHKRETLRNQDKNQVDDKIAWGLG